MADLTVTQYHELLTIAKELDRFVSHARFTDGRSGTIPPDELRSFVLGVEDAAATLRQVYEDPTAAPSRLALTA